MGGKQARIIWEHEHAYQPRRILDAYVGEERSSGALRRVMGRSIHGKNEQEVVLLPGSVYDEVARSLDVRSIDIEPLTFVKLQRINEGFCQVLSKKLKEGKTSVVCTAYSHPILPEMDPEDLRINVRWSVAFYVEKFWRGRWKKLRLIPFWLPELAVSSHVVRSIVEESAKHGAKPLFILDEASFRLKRGDCLFEWGGAFFVIRSREASDAVSFAPEVREIVRKIVRVKRKVIGICSDAENYGGNYDPLRPEKMDAVREGLSKMGYSFALLDELVENRLSKKVLRQKFVERTSWSDYFSFLRVGRKIRGCFVGRNPGDLCRWTGLDKDGWTYFMVFRLRMGDEVFVRCLCSAWKILFNKLRKDVCRYVRDFVFRRVKREIVEEYWRVALGVEEEDRFLKRWKLDEEQALLLRAYRYACQDAMISCPTFWEVMDNELAWTSLSLQAASLIFLADYAREREPPLLNDVLEFYREEFLEFGRGHWASFARSLKVPVKELGDFVRKKLRRKPSNSLEAYEEAFARPFKLPFYPGDANPYLLDVLKGKNVVKASLWEIQHSLESPFGPPLPVRVGLFHAKHIPELGRRAEVDARCFF